MRQLRKTFICIVAASACATGIQFAPKSSPLFQTTSASASAPPLVINTSDRAAILAAYSTEFNRAEPPMQWTGDVASCKPGTTSEAYQQSVLQRVNWYRAMAGVAHVPYLSELNAQQQASTLIQVATGSLSHYPPTSSPCWTQTGYDGAASSNISGGNHGVNAISSQLRDAGSNNAIVGHRWWLLHPMLKTVTSGDIPASAGKWSGNSLNVTSTYSSPPSAPRDGFVAWPPPGYVPDDVVYPRWSVMAYGYGTVATPDFTNATVTVSGPDGPLSVSYDHKGSGRIVFTPSGFASAPIQVTTDTTYSVNVSGVTGGSANSYSYQVIVTPFNRAPVPSESPTQSATITSCSLAGEEILYMFYTDVEGDKAATSLVEGEGDTDNALFIVGRSLSNGVILVAANDLDPTRLSYSVRYRLTDSGGASTDKIMSFSIADASASTTICPVRSAEATNINNTSMSVAWAKPTTGPTPTAYQVTSYNPWASCKATAPQAQCTLSNLKKGTRYSFSIIGTIGSKQSPVRTLIATTSSDNSVATTTIPYNSAAATRIIRGVIKRNTTMKFSKWTVLPIGKRTFALTGPCSISTRALTVKAPRTKGSCKVTITGQKGTSKKVVVLKLTVK